MIFVEKRKEGKADLKSKEEEGTKLPNSAVQKNNSTNK
jgi:hypothetical protein